MSSIIFCTLVPTIKEFKILNSLILILPERLRADLFDNKREPLRISERLSQFVGIVSAALRSSPSLRSSLSGSQRLSASLSVRLSVSELVSLNL